MYTIERANKDTTPLESVIQELKDAQSCTNNLLHRLRNKAEPFLMPVDEADSAAKPLGTGPSPLVGQLGALASAGNQLNNELEALIDRFVV